MMRTKSGTSNNQNKFFLHFYAKMGKSSGSATMTMLAIVMFLSIVFASIAFLVNTGILVTANEKHRLEVEKRLVTKAQEVMDKLLEDDKREYDSKFGPFQDYLASNADTVSMKDVGSALNPNMIHWELIDYLNEALLPPPAKLFKATTTNSPNNGMKLQQYWMDTGIHFNLIPDYSDFFEDDVINTYFTPYTYFNINLTNEWVLERLFKDRTGSESDAKKFHAGITTLLGQKDFIAKNEHLEIWMTTNNSLQNNIRGIGLWKEDFEKMWPVLNVESQLNVHFVDESILRVLLSYPPFALPDAQGKAQQILDARENPDKKGLTKQELQNTIGILPYPGLRLNFYLGVFTNFWELKVREKANEKNDYVLRWVIVRLPKLKLLDELEYKIIEDSFSVEPVNTPEPESSPEETPEGAGSP
jgi:hypothetical protein